MYNKIFDELTINELKKLSLTLKGSFNINDYTFEPKDFDSSKIIDCENEGLIRRLPPNLPNINGLPIEELSKLHERFLESLGLSEKLYSFQDSDIKLIYDSKKRALIDSDLSGQGVVYFSRGVKREIINESIKFKFTGETIVSNLIKYIKLVM